MEAVETANTPKRTPYLFDDYFEMGGTGSSPFLTAASRLWGQNLELKSALIAAFLLACSFGTSFIPGAMPYSNILLISVFFLVGIPSLIDSINDLVDLEINIDLLMTLAAFSSVLLGSGMEGGLLLVLFELSHALEHTVAHRARGAISQLHRLAPSRAFVVQEDGSLLERSVKDVTVGTVIHVKAGQVVPLDGRVIKGTSSLNLVHLTGENLPVTKKVDDEVPAGARNLEGALTVEVTHSNQDSTLARIIQLVTEAQEARPKLQRWFDSLSRRYATSIILFSAAFAGVLPWITGAPYLGNEGSIYRALAFLIAASPCALIIAIPIAYLSAVSACAREGILLKGGITLDALSSCSIIAFDKTGTLTTGELSLVEIAPLHTQSDAQKQEALEVAYAMEQNALHPIAKAITSHCHSNGVKLAHLDSFRAVPGYGLEAAITRGGENVPVFIGNAEYLLPKIPEADQQALQERLSEIRRQGELLAVLLVGDHVTLMRFRDTPRPLIAEAIKKLRHIGGYRLLMLTGDHRASARSVAEELKIDEYYADLRPEDKLDHVTTLAQKHGLAMIGDGVNDAPALARATVGISMGQVGSSAAIDAADVVLLHDNLEHLDWLMEKAHQTQRIVRQNLILAAGAILLATTPALMGIVPLWLAVIMHEGGTVLVGLNALRLLKRSR